MGFRTCISGIINKATKAGTKNVGVSGNHPPDSPEYGSPKSLCNSHDIFRRPKLPDDLSRI